MAEAELKAWGNSIGVIIPVEKLKELGLRKGDKIDIDIVKKKNMVPSGLVKKFRAKRNEPTKINLFCILFLLPIPLQSLIFS